MWKPQVFESKSQKLDFTSSAQGVVDVTAIYCDGQKLANAIEFMECDENPIQFFVCEECGYPQCATGNWLSLRKIGNYVFFLPAFESMDEGEWESSEYTPPYFTNVKGSLLLTEKQFGEIKKHIKMLPGINNIPELSSYEACRMLQWEAPFRVLGLYPINVEFKGKLLTTTSFKDDASVSHELNKLLTQFFSEKVALCVVPIMEDDEEISFFLDGTDFIEWVPLIKRANNFGLKLLDGYAIIEAKHG